MDEKLKAQLNQIFDAVFVYSPVEYSFAGKRVTLPDNGTAAGAAPGAALVGALQSQFYQFCYSTKFENPLPEAARSDPGSDLAPTLSNANMTRERWDYGWKIYQVTAGGSVYATKGSQTRMFFPGEFMLFENPAEPQAGAWGRVFLSKEDTRTQSGFYVVNSEIAPSSEDQSSFVRFYWNVEPAAAPALVRSISERFNRMRVPFQFKTLRYSGNYRRSDGAVLYTGRRYYGIAARLIRETCAIVKDRMKPDTPMFAKRLAPGLSLAEDPADGTSFGLSRSGLMAQSVWNAYQNRLQSEKARMKEFGAAFEARGWNADLPHLSFSTVDLYHSEQDFESL